MFAIRNLGVLQYSQGHTMWVYKSGADMIANTARPGYFNDAADMLANGDVIVVVTALGTGMRVVSRVEGHIETSGLLS